MLQGFRQTHSAVITTNNYRNTVRKIVVHAL
jgi:hypothetical protein